MEDAWAWFLLFFKKSWAGGFPFSKYPICFSIQTSQNSASFITFIVTSSSPESLLLVQQYIDREQHIDREQLSLCAFPVLKPPKSAVSKADGSNEVTPTQPPVSSPSSPATSSSDLLGNSKANYPTKNLSIFCWIREANSPWSCMIPWCDARKRTGTPMAVGTWRQKGCHLWWEPTVVQDSYICRMNHSRRRTCQPQFLYWKKIYYYKVT